MILVTASGIRVSVADEKAERLIASGTYALPASPKASPVKAVPVKSTTK